MQQQIDNTSSRDTGSPFVDYIDSIINDLIAASTAILPETTDFAKCVVSVESLQVFVNQCFLAKPSLQLDVLPAVIKIDKELYADLLCPALLRRLQASNNIALS